MSRKSNAKLMELTAGDLKYIKQWDLTVSDLGTGQDNIDFSVLTWEDATDQKPSHIKIMNYDVSNPVFVAFDAAGSTITTTDRSTYSLKINNGLPYSSITLPGSCSSIGLRCETGKTATVTIIAW